MGFQLRYFAVYILMLSTLLKNATTEAPSTTEPPSTTEAKSTTEAPSTTVVNIGDGRDPNWARKLLDSIKARDLLIPKLESFIGGVTPDTIKNLIESLDDFPKAFNGTLNLNLEGEAESGKVAEIKALQDTSRVKAWFTSGNLESYYTSRGFGHILKTLKQSLPSSGSFSGKSLPLTVMCQHVLEDIGEQDKFEISANKICKKVQHCSGKEAPRPFGDTAGTNVQDACVANTDACDVTRAVPMMTALLWYKMSDYIALGFCYNHLKQPAKSVVTTNHQEVVKMAGLISAYVSTFENWREFFDEAARVRAFSRLPIAMNLVKQRSKSFKFATLACDELGANDMCTTGNIFSYYSSLVKLKNDKQTHSMVKNLRLHARVDHAKLLELKRDSLQHLELLGNIQQLDHNLGNLVKGMSGYFYELAKYDQGIADQDTIFLEGKLADFEKRANTLSAKVQSDTKRIMIAANFALAAQLCEEIAIISAKIANNLNPLKVIFTNVEVADIYEQAGEVARAAQESFHGAALFATFSSVYNHMAELASNFKNNRDQIDGLMEMVNSIKNNKIKDLSIDSQTFIEGYGDYTPKVGRSELGKNDALWSAYKESTCDLLFGAQGIGAGVTEAVVGGMLLCEKLDGSLAEFFTFRENIFDFQFDLVDSIASAVRGNIAKKLAKEIDVKNDHLKPSALLLVFFMTQYRLQFEASLYCNKWEYINQGKTIAPCRSKNFFDKYQLENLLSYDFGTLYHEAERFVYIPTKPQFEGDTGFINLPSLAAGDPVSFRIPANRTWLRKFNWLSSEETLAPFVASFQLYLPLKNYPNDQNKKYLKTYIELTSAAGSRVDETSDVVYNVPLEHSNYITVYEQGYDSTKCPRGKEIINPYSLCDNLPLICDTMTRVPGSLIMPTILSTWHLKYSVESAHEKLQWDAPRPATDMLFVAKVKLRFLPENGRKRRSVNFGGEPAFGCCAVENTFRPIWSDRTCAPCPASPTRSTGKHQGYYCEKGDEPIAQEVPKNLYTVPTEKPTTSPQ